MPGVKKDVVIIMGSKSDLKVMSDAVDVLKDFGIDYEIKVVSAHRTPEKMLSFAKNASKKYKLIIAGAGGAAHLPGMVASLTSLPVIGVPIKLAHLDGLDSLLSVVQMPKGVPVATMAIDNAHNAGLMAVRLLALNKASLQRRLMDHIKGLKIKVHKQNSQLKTGL